MPRAMLAALTLCLVVIATAAPEVAHADESCWAPSVEHVVLTCLPFSAEFEAKTSAFGAKPFTTERAALRQAQKLACADRGIRVEDRAKRVALLRSHNRWEHLAVAARQVAFEHADTEAGPLAAKLYLEALQVLGKDRAPPRATCFDKMAIDVKALHKLHCPSNAPVCDDTQRIQIDVGRLRADAMIRRADDIVQTPTHADAAAKRALYMRAGKAYVKLWNDHGATACQAGSPACRRMDEVLWNGAKAFAAAGDRGKSIRVYKVLRNPNSKVPYGILTMRAAYEMARHYRALAVFDVARDWYLRFAREAPKESTAVTSLQDGIALSIALGDGAQADESMEDFLKIYGRKRGATAALVVFAVAKMHADGGDMPRAMKVLSKAAMPMIDKYGDLDVRIEVHALRSRLLSRTGDETGASVERRYVKTLWRQSEAEDLQSLETLEGDPLRRQRRLGRMLNALGEVSFYDAEPLRLAANAITTAPGWIAKRRAAIHEAEKAYLEILKLQPAAPPKWTLEANHAVASMWGAFHAALESAQAPAGDVERTRRIALQNYRRCDTYALKVQELNATTKRCQAWLVDHDPTASTVSELAPRGFQLENAIVAAPAPRRP